jgi:hypothetical protein
VTAYQPYQPYQAYPGPNVIATSGPPPILVAVAPPAPQPRLTVFFRLILAIPHLFVLAILGIAAEVVAFIGWWGALFTARLPQFAVDFLSGYLRWTTRVIAYVYLLTDAYPPFSLDDAPGYPAGVAIPAPQRLNRFAVFFRFILFIPAGIVAGVIGYGLGLIVFIGWLVTLVAGRLPSPFHLAFTAVLRFQTRYYAYVFMLTPAYPWSGLYGDEPGAVTWADEAQTAQVPGFGTPGSPYGTPGSPYGTPGSPYGTPGSAYGTPGWGSGSPSDFPQQPGGYGVPDYPAAGGYGVAAGYHQAQPTAQPRNWSLPLTSAAKGLVTTIIVLGVLLDVGLGARNFITTTSAFDRGYAGHQLRTSYTTLSNSLDAWHQATVNCGQNLTCVTRQDGKAAALFTTFSSQLASTSVPADSTAAKAKVAADSATVAQDLTQLSKATTASQYDATVASTGLQQELHAFDTDFAALMTGLGVPTTTTS